MKQSKYLPAELRYGKTLWQLNILISIRMMPMQEIRTTPHLE